MNCKRYGGTFAAKGGAWCPEAEQICDGVFSVIRVSGNHKPIE